MLVFVYGTLTDPAAVDDLLDDWTFAGEAVLSGLHRVDGAHPTLAPGGRAEGRLLRTTEVERLDAYEGVGRGLYVRAGVPVVGTRPDPGGARDVRDTVDVYVGDPARLCVADGWPGEGGFEERVGAYLAANDVVVRPVDDR